MKITIQEARSVSLPPQTKTYIPVSNGDLDDLIHKYLDQYGITNYTIDVSSDRNKKKFLIKYYIPNAYQKMGGPIVVGHEMGGLITVGNSYDKSRAVTISIGTMVLACSNGMITSVDSTFNLRKHTKNVFNDLDNLTKEAFFGIPKTLTSLANDMNKLKTAVIDKKTMYALVGSMYIKEKLLNSVQMSILRNEIEFSKHFSMIKSEDMHMWNFYNNVTESLKTSHPTTFVTNHQKVHNYLMNKAMLTKPTDG